MLRIAGSASMGLALASLVVSCTSSLVPTGPTANDEGDPSESGTDSDAPPQPSDDGDDEAPADDGNGDDDTPDDTSGGNMTASDVEDDGPVDSGSEETDTGEPVQCAEPEVGNVRADVWPGMDPLEHPQIVRELDCVIEDRITAGDGVSFQMSCEKDGVPLSELVVVGVEAEGITVPASLAVGVSVHARVYTGRDLDDIAEFPWRRADHFALYRDGVLVLGAGAGVSFPMTTGGDPFVDFWAPFVFGSLPSACPGEQLECHSLTRGIWELATEGTSSSASPFSVVHMADYEIHLGELVTGDSPQCSEPPYGWLAFAIAPA